MFNNIAEEKIYMYYGFLNNETKVILDTSVLNHLFTDNIDIGAEVLGVLNLYKENVWIPYTVYDEFLKINNEDLINKKIRDYKKIGSELSNEYEKFNQEIQKIYMNVNKNNYHKWKVSEEKIVNKLKEIKEIIIESKKNIDENEYKKNIQIYLGETQKFVEQLYNNGQVGKKFGANEIIEICKEGSIRYECMLPPGYSDSGKKGIDKYNDLFIWKEILNYSRQESIADIIFLTDDNKTGNWWSKKSNEKTIHEYLKQEFYELNNDVEINIDFMTLTQFFEYCQGNYNIETCLKLEEEKQIEKLIKIYEDKICDELHSYVVCMDYTEICNEFYKSNDSEVYFGELELCSHSMQVMEQEIIYNINVKLPFSLVIADEDNEGDRFIYGEAELLVSAIIEIKQKYVKNCSIGNYTILTSKVVNEQDFSVDSISYITTSLTDPYDYYE